jgi:hypothetical protein
VCHTVIQDGLDLFGRESQVMSQQKLTLGGLKPAIVGCQKPKKNAGRGKIGRDVGQSVTAASLNTATASALMASGR